jgi:hypothetical protein
MSNVINFLEKMGRDAQLRHASRDDLQNALLAGSVSAELSVLLLAGNQSAIESLLGQMPLCCAMFPVKEDEEESEESPAKDDDEISSRISSRLLMCVG